MFQPCRRPLLSVLAALCTFAGDALAAEGGGTPERDQPLSSVRAASTSKEESQNPVRDSTLIFDQSMTTQTAHIEPTPQQSYVPLYEIWLSFRPRYHFDEHWFLRGRFDYTKELTNNQSTTYYREDVFGDIWTDLVYGAKLDRFWRGTKASAGLRAIWPTSKVSQASGTFVTVGPTVAASHKFPVNGDDAPFLDDVHLGLILTYLHPFSTATTPTGYGGFAYPRQDVDGFSFISDQVSGTTLVNHSLTAVLDAGVQIAPKLSFSADAILINQWHYKPSSQGLPVGISSSNDAQFIQETWIVASVDYQLADELDLGFGYYNLANDLGPDGHRRALIGPENIWWSPDARVFFDLTANLDVIFDDAAGHPYSSRRAGQAARRQRVANVGQ